jgi:hypothetical protein
LHPKAAGGCRSPRRWRVGRAHLECKVSPPGHRQTSVKFGKLRRYSANSPEIKKIKL